MSDPASPPGLEWLNYHHLLYFWTVAREGGVSRAAQRLRLSQPTISAQVRRLEASLGERLLAREGRGVVLTDAGRLVFRYADELFGIGRELLETLRGRPAGRAAILSVGVVNVVPKLIAYRLLQPARHGAHPFNLICREADPEELLTQLATHALDVLITDAPAPPHVRVKVFNHLLGESATAFFAPPRLASRLRRRFPVSLDRAPMVLPTGNTALRRGLDQWFEAHGIRPEIVGEFEDSALMKVFGQGDGVVFAAPAVIAADVRRVYRVGVIGQTGEVRERYYAISAERRVTHPGVIAITHAARDAVFTSKAGAAVTAR